MSFAEVTGISITMLGQIERCESHLSIATVWKIANGLKLSITALISEPVQDASVIPLDRVRMWTEDEGRIRIYPHFSIEDGRPFETYMMEMDQYGVLRAAPHNKGTEEFIWAFEGELIVRVHDQEYAVPAGAAIRPKADKPHAYQHAGYAMTRLSMVIHYSH
ncbi:helix-turn-helix domain-containing protein [Paenibacillus sp. FSL W8-0426]|uniref:helix-turn-helix domain-containing protein n=1 Tax=Paenibacillus sp. FSL W8-0426 TaxID=2921714 RepID=UPI0030DB9907